MIYSRLGTIGLVFSAFLGLILVAGNHSWALDLKGADRYNTEIVEDTDYTDDTNTGRRVSGRRTTRQGRSDTSANTGGAPIPTTGQPVSAETDPAGDGVVDTGQENPITVPPVIQPAGGAGQQPQPGDPAKRDNLEVAKRMLEEQLQKLRKAQEQRKGEQGQPGVAPGQPPAPGQEPILARDVITLFLDPLEARPGVGESFVSTVELENNSGKEFDEVGFVLRYNPKALRVMDGDENLEGINVHDASFREEFPWERGPAFVNRVDQENGLVTYRAKWTESAPLKSGGPIAAVTFEVIKGLDSDLSFVFEDLAAEAEAIGDGSPVTYVRLKGKDVLGRQTDPADGTVYAKVRFYDSPEERAVGDLPMGRSEDLGTRISIYPTVESLYRGQEFDYVVEIENPNRVEFDEVTLVLAYNPRYLRPIDRDAGNYISKGVNLFDGDYHATFPFNHHRRNEVDMDRGIMVYQMGTLRKVLSSSGVLLSVRFRALAPTGDQGSRLKIGFVKGSFESGLSRRGSDVLGDPDEWKDGFEVYSVRILPLGVSQK